MQQMNCETCAHFKACKRLIDARYEELVPCEGYQPLYTVDAAPVVHGKWLNFYGDFSTAECNKCTETFEVSTDEEPKEEYFNAFKQFYKFCPNCGAKMDGDSNSD